MIINAVGASFFARANTIITWTKFALPILVAITLLATYFSPANFTEYGGFAPFGARGVMEAVSAGGVVFALIGFRHAIDMAGEAKNPKTTVPLALLLGLLFPAVVYLLIQVAFIGALKPEHLAHGWANIHLAGRLGPIASVAATLGMSWLMASIYGAVVVAPIGGGLVATGSTSRLAYALSKNQFLPKWLEVLSKSHVPVRALWVNVVLGMVLLASLPFKGILTVNSAAITLSFVAGPLAVVALRKQMPHAKRSFKLPLLRTQALLGFVVATLIVYWSGWKTNVVLFGIIVFAVVFVGIKRLVFDKHPFKSLDRREAIWLAPYIATIMVVSYLGNFGGGRGILPVWWDVAVLSVLTCANFWLADWCRLSEEQARIYRHRHIDPEVVPHSDRHGPRPDLDEPG